MKRVLIAYYSRSGNTEKMAQYIAEGVRITGHEADTKSITQISAEKDLTGYDGYIFGCPTYHLDMPEPFKAFLVMAGAADLKDKVGGAFDCRTHPSSGEGSAAALIFDTMESRFGMRMTDLGPFDLKPDWIDGGKPELMDTLEGIKACQQYGKSVGEMLGTS
jgi:flavodoxin